MSTTTNSIFNHYTFFNHHRHCKLLTLTNSIIINHNYHQPSLLSQSLRIITIYRLHTYYLYYYNYINYHCRCCHLHHHPQSLPLLWSIFTTNHFTTAYHQHLIIHYTFFQSPPSISSTINVNQLYHHKSPMSSQQP